MRFETIGPLLNWLEMGACWRSCSPWPTFELIAVRSASLDGIIISASSVRASKASAAGRAGG